MRVPRYGRGRQGSLKHPGRQGIWPEEHLALVEMSRHSECVLTLFTRRPTARCIRAVHFPPYAGSRGMFPTTGKGLHHGLGTNRRACSTTGQPPVPATHVAWCPLQERTIEQIARTPLSQARSTRPPPAGRARPTPHGRSHAEMVHQALGIAAVTRGQYRDAHHAAKMRHRPPTRTVDVLRVLRKPIFGSWKTHRNGPRCH